MISSSPEVTPAPSLMLGIKVEAGEQESPPAGPDLDARVTSVCISLLLDTHRGAEICITALMLNKSFVLFCSNKITDCTWGETAKVENRGETTRGETTRGKRLGGETSCYRVNSL